MVSVSEPTLSFMMEARLGGLSATIALLIPWSAIAPVADQFAAREDGGKGDRSEDDEMLGPPRRRRRRDDGPRRGRRRDDADRGRAGAQGGRPAAAQRARLRRHHDLRRQGAGAHRAARPLPAAAAPCRSPATWVVADERLRSARPARPVDRRGLPRRARDVRPGQGQHRRGHDPRRPEGGLRRRPRPVRGDGRLLRRRRHRRQRLPDHARRRAPARGVDDGHGAARGPGRPRALRARALRRL